MKYLKLLLIIFVVAFGGFVGWMNVTPGHFQKICCYDRVGYTEDLEISGKRICPLMIVCVNDSLWDRILLGLATFDLNK